jgi:hypothetical protein
MPMAVPQAQRKAKAPKPAKTSQVDAAAVNEALEHARIVQAKVAMMRGKREKPGRLLKLRSASSRRAAPTQVAGAPKKRLEEPQELLAKLLEELDRSANAESSSESTEAEILAARADALKSLCRFQDHAQSLNRACRSRSATHFRVQKLAEVFKDEAGVSAAGTISAEKSGKLRRSRSMKA